MHLIGDCAYWINTDASIGKDDALAAVIDAAEELGRKHIDRTVFEALRSSDYRSMLDKVIGASGLDEVFTRSRLLEICSHEEKGKIDKFLHRMRDINVLVQGEKNGEYKFAQRMTQLYLWLRLNHPSRSLKK
jgi:hypothetical protein